MEDFLTNIYALTNVLSIYFFICMITSLISLWFIFKKENIKPYYSLIPFLNIYHYYKICELPFWTIFIPVVNLITVYCSTYTIVKKYQCPKWQCFLSIFLPFIFLPYIAFSKKRNINFVYNNTYIKNIKDIDKLDALLANNNYVDEESIVDNTQIKNTELKTTIVDEIENSIIYDEYIYDEPAEIKEYQEEIPEPDTFNDSFVEIDDNIDLNDLSLESVDKLEENIKVESSVEKNLEKNIQDYQEIGPSNEAIAFGGENQIENKDNVQTKNDELKCERCGSSLVGANGYCPGCGAKI